jgi:uncharacterized protein YkwD
MTQSSITRQKIIKTINDYRAVNKLARLLINAELVSDSDTWAKTMSTTNHLAHDPNASTNFSQKWVMFGENVGQSDVNKWLEMMEAFKKSPGHNANMLNPAYNRIGAGLHVNTRNNGLYVCVRFAKI